jgi:hypothetical protein
MFGGFSATKNLLLNDLWKLDLTNVTFETKANDLAGASWTTLTQQGEVPKARKGH